MWIDIELHIMCAVLRKTIKLCPRADFFLSGMSAGGCLVTTGICILQVIHNWRKGKTAGSAKKKARTSKLYKSSILICFNMC